MQVLEKLLQDFLLSILGNYLVGSFLALFIGCWLAYWFWKRVRQTKYGHGAKPLAFLVGSIGFAVWLFITMLYNEQSLRQQIYLLESARAERELNKEKELLEQSSPDHLERMVRDWLDKAGYPTAVQNNLSLRVLPA